MIKSRALLAGVALAAVSAAAHAGLSVTPAVATDYDFRGISQTGEEYDPAVSLGITYNAANGFYVGAWGSNIDFGPGDPSVELDGFAGFAGGDAAESFAYDLGVIYYSYVSASDFNYTEVYAGISKGWFAAKIWYSWDWGGDTLPAGISSNAYYLEANGTFPLPNDFSFVAHLGYSAGDYWKDTDSEYFDWSVGVTKSLGNFALALKYVDGSDYEAGKNAEFFNSDSKVLFTVSTTLPWKSE